MTFSEIILWNELKRGQMMGYDFDRQTPILKYIVDFFCKDIRLAIEIDDDTHDDDLVAIKDDQRQKELESVGVRFLRFNALEVVHDMKNILITIENCLLNYEDLFGVPANVARSRLKI